MIRWQALHLKPHLFTLYTGAVKNQSGVIPGTRKREMHCRALAVKDFSQILVDVLQLVSIFSVISPFIGLHQGKTRFLDRIRELFIQISSVLLTLHKQKCLIIIPNLSKNCIALTSTQLTGLSETQTTRPTLPTKS